MSPSPLRTFTRSPGVLVDVLVPVLWRPGAPGRFLGTLEASGEADSCQVTVVVNASDTDTLEAWTARDSVQVVIVGEERRSFACKANDGYRRTEAPWILIVGDDVRFERQWLTMAFDAGAPGRAQVIGTNDLGLQSRGELSPHLLIRREYVDERGASWDGPRVLCHEGYSHNYVDREIQAVAQQRGVYAFARRSVIEHLHHAASKAPVDATYQLGTATLAEDKALWKQREREHLR